MSKAAAINKLNEEELQLGLAGTDGSWHEEYRTSPTIFIGGLATSHTEKDILSIFEQFGTLIHVNLVRDPQTQQSRRFAFANYADARSAVLAVDNLNAVEIDGSTLCVDHVRQYRMPQPCEAFDTTPTSLAAPDTRSGTPTDDSVVISHKPTASSFIANQEKAEREREIAVMARLQELRKRRRIEATTASNDHLTRSPDTPETPQAAQLHEGAISFHPNDSNDQIVNINEQGTERDERQQRRIEKERRKAHRAAIRQARAERRSQRERQNR